MRKDVAGGVRNNLLRVGERLASRGHEVDYVWWDDVPRPIGWLPDRLSFPSLVVPEVLARLRKKRYDILQFKSNDGLFYGLLRRLNRRLPPCVFASYQLEEAVWEDELEEARRGHHHVKWKTRANYFWTMILPQRIALATADFVVGSAYDRPVLSRRYGFEPGGFHLWYNGADPELFVDRAYQDPPRILFNGSWHWRKGPPYLLAALERILTTDPRLTATLITSENCDASARLPAGVRPRVRVSTGLSDEALRAEYLAHEVFLFPTVCDMPPPLAVMEAMAAGQVAVTSALPGMDDVVRPGTVGVLVPPRDVDGFARAVLDLAADPGRVKRMGCAAREQAKRHTWDQVAADLEAAYLRLLERGAR